MRSAHGTSRPHRAQRVCRTELSGFSRDQFRGTQLPVSGSRARPAPSSIDVRSSRPYGSSAIISAVPFGPYGLCATSARFVFEANRPNRLGAETRQCAEWAQICSVLRVCCSTDKKALSSSTAVCTLEPQSGQATKCRLARLAQSAYKPRNGTESVSQTGPLRRSCRLVCLVYEFRVPVSEEN